MSSARSTLRRRSTTAVFWVLALLVAAVALYRFQANAGPPPVKVAVHRVSKGTVRDLVTSSAAGRVGAHREVTLRAELGGTVVKLHHRRGDKVAAGAPLVSFDPQDLAHRLRIAEVGVMLGKAQAAQAEANAAVVSKNANLAKQLAAVGAMPGKDAESVEAQEEAAKKGDAVAEVGVAQGSANAALARLTLKKATVAAPFAGLVLSTATEEGEILPGGAPLLVLADTTAMHVDADFDEMDLGRLALGLRAELSFDAFPQRLFGAVTEIAPLVTKDLRGNRSISLRFALGDDPRLRVGMSVDVDVIVSTRTDVVWVPPSSVLGRGTDRAVYVVDGAVVRKRKVDVGVATWETVEIKGGVGLGELVVIDAAAPGLKDGAKVVYEPDKPATTLVGKL